MSAIPKPQPKDWLAAAADELRLGDRAVLTILQASYRNVNSILKGLPDGDSAAPGNLIYRAQLERTRRELLDEQAKLFEKLGDVTSARRLRSASRAAKLSAAANNTLLRLVGEDALGKLLYDGAKVTAQRTVETLLARAKLSAVPLAERIYNTQSWMNKRLDLLITQTMAGGLNAQKFAKVARDWFAPSVPGGTRYAAMRLARTEINNAFHATSIVYAQDKPWVNEMDWHLSKSHPTPDVCNTVAAASPYAVSEVPRKPHPQCMCYVTEVTPDEDDWIDRYVKGDFDEYMNAEMAKADAALGIKPEKDAPQTQPKQQKVNKGTSLALPKTQAAALDKFQDGMTRDEWQANGAGINAIDQLGRKGIVIKTGETKTVEIHGQKVEQLTYQLASTPKKPPSRLLGIYGDRLHIDPLAGAEGREHIHDLEAIPDAFHARVDRLMSKNPVGGIFVGNKPVPELSPQSAELRRVRPRGWAETQTWSSVPGAFLTEHSQLLIGGGGAGHGSSSIAGHEFGHAFHATLPRDDKLDFERLFEQIEDLTRMNPYFTRAGNPGGTIQEGFAESFAGWAATRGDRNKARETIKETLGIRDGKADRLVSQIVELFEGWEIEFR